MISRRNIYYMLAYAFRTLDQREYRNINPESFDNAEDILAVIITKGITYQIKRGIGRDYVPVQERIPGVKGRIELFPSLRRDDENTSSLVCTFDEFSQDIDKNRIVKTAGMILLKSNKVKQEHKKSLKNILMYLGDISTVDPKTIRWDQIRYHRNDSSYETLINISRLVFDSELPSEEQGKRKIGFFEDEQKMHALYEKFVLEYYRKHYPSLRAYSHFIDWNVEGNSQMLPVMRTDITIQSGNRMLIIDTKYYGRILSSGQYSRLSLNSSNLYQIFSYVRNEDIDRTGNVQGMLLYAKTDEENFDDQVYIIDGNQISVKTLDLNVEFSVIQDKLDGIIRNWLGNDAPTKVTRYKV